ncbi:hypothetical protein [Blastococcus tunisiensis]|uniref:hypothetical protein n=1 Tax=Blastococcus tunisiensis TaxID=1798228 RepID=UPI000B87F788|nr:hypothetical protein [Blastococcus sp. DSM 46838]
MTSIFLAPGAQLRLVFDEIGVEAGPGAHRLALRYQATPVGLPPGSVALISGAVRLQHTLSWIGALQADQPLLISAAGVYPRSVLLGTTISDPQLAGIEADRNGSDLELLIDLKVTLVGAASMDYPASDAQDWVRIRGPIWAAHAERLGALVTVPLMVPLPLGDPDSLRAQAGRRLQSAVRALADGRAEDAVRDARLALDLYDRLDPPAAHDDQRAPRQRDLAQRFAVLRNAVHSLASGAHHDDAVTADFRYDRRDASVIVTCVAALLQRH